MRRIVYPFRARSSQCRAIAAVITVLAAASAMASERPRYGGTLRVQMHDRVEAIDPRQWPLDSVRAAASERLTSLVFDRLVRLDDHVVAQPALAVSWQHDAQSKRWQFRLREGVKFSDGTPLTPESAALALQQLLGNAFDVSCR